MGDDGGLTVFASKAGATTNPDWYYNLKANPDITVEYGDESFDAEVEELPEAEGQARLQAQAALIPTFARIRHLRRPRVIPAFSISRV